MIVLVHRETNRCDGGISFGIVIIIKNGSGGHGRDAVPRMESERECGTAGRWPEVKNYAIRLNLVSEHTLSRFRSFQRGAVNFCSWRQSHFRKHHAVATKSGAFRVDVARNLICQLRLRVIVLNLESQGASFTSFERLLVGSLGLGPRKVIACNQSGIHGSLPAWPNDFNFVRTLCKIVGQWNCQWAD